MKLDLKILPRQLDQAGTAQVLRRVLNATRFNPPTVFTVRARPRFVISWVNGVGEDQVRAVVEQAINRPARLKGEPVRLCTGIEYERIVKADPRLLDQLWPAREQKP